MRGHLARLGPPEFITVAPGEAPVAVTTEPNRCWAASPGKNGITKHVRCDNRARPGRLTCWCHRRWESAARELKARKLPEMVSELGG